MKRLLFILAALAAVLALPGTASAGACGLPDAKPLWIDYAVASTACATPRRCAAPATGCRCSTPST